MFSIAFNLFGVEYSTFFWSNILISQLQHYLIWEKLDSDAMFIQSVPENHHVFSSAAIVLDHSEHLIIFEQVL